MWTATWLSCCSEGSTERGQPGHVGRRLCRAEHRKAPCQLTGLAGLKLFRHLQLVVAGCSRCDIAPGGRGNICAFSRTRPLGGIELLWHSLAASILSWYGALYALLLRCSVASRSRPADAIHPASKASESRLYTFSGETKEHLRKFRLTTSRAKDPQAVICTHRPFEPSIQGFAPDRLTWCR